MDEERWLRTLLEACDRAIDGLRAPGIEPDQGLLADLEQYRGLLERRLHEPRDIGGEAEHR